MQLPYVGAHFSAVVVMPKSESLNKFVGGLTAGGLDGLIADLKSTRLGLSMPSLTLADRNELDATLKSLGMKDAFDSHADLSALSPTRLLVTTVLQKATLDVTSWGSEATAATAVGLQPFSREVPSVTMTINRPYLFLIRDTRSGTILFAARVSDP